MRNITMFLSNSSKLGIDSMVCALWETYLFLKNFVPNFFLCFSRPTLHFAWCPWWLTKVNHTIAAALWIPVMASQWGSQRRSERRGDQLPFRPKCIGAGWSPLSLLLSSWLFLLTISPSRFWDLSTLRSDKRFPVTKSGVNFPFLCGFPIFRLHL